MHFDLEDLAFQDFKEDIVFANGSVLPMKPCLPVVARSLLVHHDILCQAYISQVQYPIQASS